MEESLDTVNRVQHFPRNHTGRDLVCGDVHGHPYKLQRALSDADFEPRNGDRLFCVGDLVDRGPRSLDALCLLLEPWFHCCMGNHEWMLLNWIKGRHDQELYFNNGGQWAASLNEAERAEVAKMITELPLAMVVGAGTPGRFNVLHAEFHGDDVALDRGNYGSYDVEHILWGRAVIRGLGEPPVGLSTTYVGHTIRRQVERCGPFVYIDTGSYTDGGRVTVLEPATGREWSSI